MVSNFKMSFGDHHNFKIIFLSVSFLLAASPGFQVERKLEVDDSSEVLQILQMRAIGMNFF